MTLGHRMSSLPVVQYCGQAGGAVGSGRAAVVSTAFHAVCANAPDKDAKLARLTDEERKTLESWHAPEPFKWSIRGEEVELRYFAAETEVEVGLTAEGTYVDPNEPFGEPCISIGHLDMGWVLRIPNVVSEPPQEGMRIAVIGDIKRSEWTVEEGPESLQLHAYGHAYASKHQCDYYVPAIWAAVEGRWWFGEMVDLYSVEAAAIWEKLRHAIQNTGEFAMGPHCRKCYRRFQCPAYVMPPELAETSLAPLVDGGLTQENAYPLLMAFLRAKDLVDPDKSPVAKTLRDWAAKNGGIRAPDGSVWGPRMQRGKESCGVKRLREMMGADAEKYIARGKDYEVFTWK